MRLGLGKNISFVLFFIAEKITSILATASRFVIIDTVLVNRSSNPITVSVNQSAIPFFFSSCHGVEGNFSVDNRGHEHPYRFSNQTLDLFRWGANQLRALFQSVVDWSHLSANCVLQTVGEYANHSFVCNNNQTNLAVFYAPSYPYRQGLISFINGNSSVVLCETGTNGFMVAGYQPHLIALSRAQSSVAESSSFNPLWLIPILSGSAFLLLLVYKGVRRNVRASVSPYCHRLGEDRGALLAAARADADQIPVSTYGSVNGI
ncbi:hypothetical protein CbuD7D7780_08765 [Coxiella burnetii]|uniref:Uncharacterized protein n=1 Tax=Coxiella burnetii (strain Dugway 5J108-111) TaxID=434922 RepID=A9KGI1_COXBN|nr:hypothetical protein [Coxiella burnetii]ABS76997.1 hypothetical protein CBUD_1693 [Coxiella burnetii Dugway 5J108-111]OYK79574.1 hypothetical protein CbuD7E6568_08750 [Coxiella burnetii]OYK81656.1 hypothetical protein CbuD7D7780_08765 [Coxiella burnetii]